MSANPPPLRPYRPAHIKLSFIIICCILVVLGVSFLYTAYNAHDDFKYELDDRFSKLKGYSDVLSESVANEDGLQILKLLELVRVDPDVLRVEVLDADVRPIASSESEEYGKVQVESRIVLPITEDGSDVGWLVAEVGAKSFYQQQSTRVQDSLLTLFLVVATVVASLLIYQARFVNRPLQQLLGAISRSRESGEFVRVGSKVPNDEFGIIIKAYNELLEEVDTKHRSLKESESRFRHLYNQTPALLFSLSPTGVIESVSEHFLNQLGYDAMAIVGRPLTSLMSERAERPRIDKLLVEISMQKTAQAYLQIRNGSGEIHSMRIDATRRPDGKGALGVMTDITSLDEALSTIERQANFDALTGLPNRHFFKLLVEEQLSDEGPKDGRVALLFVDLDRFKYVNDTYGHQTGDKLLSAAGKRIQASLPAGDFVARLGGDEFAVLVHGDVDDASLLQLAHKLIKELEGSFLIDQCTMHISASIGIAIKCSDTCTPDVLLKSADLAMYRAKSEGRGRACIFVPEDEQRTLHRVNTESMLRESIQNGYFELYYQPVFAMGTQRIVGAEALVRLRHPERGLLAPGEFIDVAEDTGLIVQLGEWVLEEGLRQLSFWHRDYDSSIYLSINVSSKQLQDNRFVRTLEMMLSRYRIKPGFLILEITETMLMHNTDHTLEVMNRLKRLGCLLSIDDFGTGYSSLSYL
ncbi:MAG: EAL domain-containing protein, partial [Oceanospirillales bacterium]|nr:EAL domain-containing protein [Oceanospirillales bacterium]